MLSFWIPALASAALAGWALAPNAQLVRRGVWALASIAAVSALFLGAGRGPVAGQPLQVRLDAVRATGEAPSDPAARAALLAEDARRAPDNAQIQAAYGAALLAAGRSLEAARAFATAVAIEPTADGYTGWAEAAIAANDARVGEAAADLAAQALSIDPDHPWALRVMALHDIELGDVAAAADHWRHALRSAPRSEVWARALAAEAAIALSRPRVAAATVEATARAGPPSPTAMVAGLERRLDADPDDFPGWLVLARAKAALNDRAGAEGLMTRAEARFAEDPGAAFILDAARVAWPTSPHSAQGMTTP